MYKSGPETIWNITHRNRHGEILNNIHTLNTLAKEGKALFMDVIYENASLTEFYVRLFNTPPTLNDGLGNLAGEPAVNGYQAQLIERSNIGWPTTALTIPADETDTAQSADANSIVLAGAANATDDHYTFSTIEITGGTGAGQIRLITAYTGSTLTAVIDSAWLVNPDNTSTYIIYSDSFKESKLITFNATGGAWGPVSHAVVSDEATGITGKLLHYFPLTTSITLADGDTLDFSGKVRLG